jgi:hypothetical protein
VTLIFLLILPNLEDEIHLKGVGFVTPKILIIVFNKNFA